MKHGERNLVLRSLLIPTVKFRINEVCLHYLFIPEHGVLVWLIH